VTLPAAQPRKPLHTRQVTFRAYERDDGLWDIDAELIDTKAYTMNSQEWGPLPPGTHVHDMAIRVTLDDRLTIRAIATSMRSAPFAECPNAVDPMQQMVGHTMGRGWRFTVDKILGANRGCTHLRELLFNMATAAYQAIPNYRMQKMQEAGTLPPSDGQPPQHLGKCMSLDFDGPVVRRYYPLFAGWKARAR